MPKYDLVIDPPIMNAAGSLGFAPEARRLPEIEQLGAFITNPVSLAPRTPARGPRLLNYPGGFLIHSGLSNPGLREVIRRFSPRWRHSPLPVLVHLIPQDAGELVEMVRRLEDTPGVAGLEVGAPPQTNIHMLVEMFHAASGELPIIARLPLHHGATYLAHLAAPLMESDVMAISFGPPRGALPTPAGQIVDGRLYGPGIFPQAMATLHHFVKTGIPVIGAGGLYSLAQVEAMLAAGALGVQLDTILWRDPLSIISIPNR